jgi:hypothetical protein
MLLEPSTLIVVPLGRELGSLKVDEAGVVCAATLCGSSPISEEEKKTGVVAIVSMNLRRI